MSYNISSWKIKKSDNLKIPMSSFYKHPRTDWHPDTEYDWKTGETCLFISSTEIRGTVDSNNILAVRSIECHGEGSGTALNWIIEPALKDSTGELDVVMVWEGGDSIDRMMCKNGKVEYKPIEL
jgi:hypothetical protein